MKVISVDAAPGKKSVVFDDYGQCIKIPASELAQYCRKIAEENSVLLCWDAPLTGPPHPDAYIAEKYAYTKRIVERFFCTGNYDTPTGISVQSYSGCPHWTITRASIGLPRLGRFDLHHKDLPFLLVHNWDSSKEFGQYVVEIHPAVAIWLWCRNTYNGPWNYKHDPVVLNDLWDILHKKWQAMNVSKVTQATVDLQCPKKDDELNADDKLDAIVGWVLGTLLLDPHNKNVEILGDKLTGSFVLPVDECLRDKFKKFSDAEKKRLGL